MVAGLVLGACSVGALAFARAPALLALCAFLAAVTGDMYRPAMNAAVADVIRPRTGHAPMASCTGRSTSPCRSDLSSADSLRSEATGLCSLPTPEPLWCGSHRPLPGPRNAPAGPACTSPRSGAGQGLRRRAVPLLSLLPSPVRADRLRPVAARAAHRHGGHGLGPSATLSSWRLNCAGVVLLQPILSPRLPPRGRRLAAGPLGRPVRRRLRRQRDWREPRRYGVGAALVDGGRGHRLPVASTMVANLSPPRCAAVTRAHSRCAGAPPSPFLPSPQARSCSAFGGRTLWLLCLAVALARLRGPPPHG